MITKSELIIKIQNMNVIHFRNGQSSDAIHLGQILAQYIENEFGTKAYQSFNELLNETLTLESCQEILVSIEKGALLSYYTLYLDIKDLYDESIIIAEFKSLVELIEMQLNDLVKEKSNEVELLVSKIIKDILIDNLSLSAKMNYDSAYKYILPKVMDKLNLETRPTSSLSKFSIKKANNEVLIKQISNNLIAFSLN